MNQPKLNGSAALQSLPAQKTSKYATKVIGALDWLETPTEGPYRLAIGDGYRMGQIIGWSTNWQDLSESLSVPEVGQKLGAFWCAADYGGRTKRIRDNVQGVSLIVLDVEAKTKQPPPLADALALCEARGWQAFAHTTYTHKPNAPRYRLCMAPSRTIKPEELRRLVEAVAQELDLECACDLAASGDPARLYYTPRVASEDDKAIFEHGAVEGGAVDVDEILQSTKPEAVKPEPAPSDKRQISNAGQIGDDLRSAMEFLDPDTYESWLSVLMALKTAPIDNAQELAHWWSARSAKYNNELCQAKWESLKPDRTSYEVIFSKAHKLGWVNPASGGNEFDFSSLFGSANSETGEIGSLLKPVSVLDVLTNPSPPPEFVWDGYIPRGVVTLLGAHGGTGKSTIALMLAVCVALGRPLFGAEVEPCKVLLVSLEDSGSIARHRLAHICKFWGIDPLALLGVLHIVDGTEYPELFSTTNHGPPFLTDTYKEMRTIVQTDAIGLVIVDNASDAYGGDEIKRRQVRAFIRALEKVIKPTNAACLLLAHVDKSTSKNRKAEGEGYSGSTAWHNSARSRLFLTRGNDGLLTLEHQKSNLGRMHHPVNLEWAPNELPKLVDQSSLEDRLSTVASNVQVERTKAVLSLIAEFEDRQQYCSPIATARNNVHVTLSCEPNFRKLKMNKSECRHILNECQRKKWLGVVDYLDHYRKSRKRWSVTESGRAFSGVFASSAPSCGEYVESEQGEKAPPSAPCAEGVWGKSAAQNWFLESTPPLPNSTTIPTAKVQEDALLQKDSHG